MTGSGISRSTTKLLAAIALAAGLTAAGLTTGTVAEGSPKVVATTPGTATVTPTPTITGPPPTWPGPSPFPPTIPGGLVATQVTAGSVTLSWTASNPGCCLVAGYDISYYQAFNDIYWTTSVGNVTTVTITSNIRAATQYAFRVSARDVTGQNSPVSNSVTVVTPATDTGPDVTPPSAPTGLKSTGVTSAGAALSWSPSTDDTAVVGYDIYRFDGWYTSVRLGTVTGTTFTAPLSQLGDFYYVRARDAAGNVSIASNTVTGLGGGTPPPTTTPPAPTCRVGYQVTAQWAGGFVATVTITNTGPAPVDGWTLGFALGSGQKVTSSWNGSFTQTGPAVTVKNARWNAVLAPGAAATVGLQGTWRSGNPAPVGYTLNGAPCTVG
ncbi:cellulose binding domain-containing protein [Micromonosporaceae bacterium Da 78-11]